VHHSRKIINKKEDKEARTRGASAFIDAVRAVYELEKTDKDFERKVILTKDNYGAGKILNGFEKIIQLTTKFEIKINKATKLNEKFLKNLEEDAQVEDGIEEWKSTIDIFFED
jgi:hypothetical protein